MSMEICQAILPDLQDQPLLTYFYHYLYFRFLEKRKTLLRQLMRMYTQKFRFLGRVSGPLPEMGMLMPVLTEPVVLESLIVLVEAGAL